jgi:cytosine/adenosine deaminase-related metal-dependent hydrolase
MLLKNARVYRHDGDTDQPDIADVLVRDGKIAAIGPDRTAEEVETVDLDGHLLAPGFVNGHYHSHDVLAKGMFETLPLERWGLVAGPIGNNRSLEEVRVRTMLGAVECVRNGITTIQDFSNLAPLDERYVDAIVEAYAAVGVRVVLSVTVRDQSQLDTILWAREMVPPELHGAIGTQGGDARAQLDFVEAQITRLGLDRELLVWALSPSAPQRCSLPLLEGVAALAAKYRLPVYTHVYESRLQRLFARETLGEFGGSTIAYMKAAGLLGPHVTIAHGVWPDDAEIAQLAESGTRVVLNMLSNLRLRSGVAPLAAYRAAGIPLSLGCDNCSCSDTQSMTQVMKLYCLLAAISDAGPARPTAAEAIRLATLGGAAAAGCGDRFGAIEVGMSADMVAYDLEDPTWRPFNSAARQLVFAETGRAVRHVWVAGRPVVRDGRCVTVDERRLIEDVGAVMPAVRKTLGTLMDNAEKLRPSFEAIQERAFATDLGYDRYLSRL